MGRIQDFYNNYQETLRFVGINIDPRIILFATFIFTIVAAFVGFFVDVTLAVLLPILIIDMGVGIPYYLRDKKVSAIEERLPDVLHHMGTTLKTGGTIEVALREVTKVDYGPITAGAKEMLREISAGKTFEESFSDFALKSHSKLMQRAAVIIIAARKSGGALLETLSAMAEDIRALYRLKRERRTKTFLQFLFITVAGTLIAPFVFGIVKSVLQILVQIGGKATPEVIALVASFDLLFKTYIVVEAALSTLAAVQVREGAFSKAVIYIPVSAVIAYLIYIAVASQFLRLIGG